MFAPSIWLTAFLESAEAETRVLQANGADCQVEARERLIDRLKAAAATADDETLTVEEVVALTGVNPETVRRAVRRGEVPDARASNKQTIRIRKADVPRIAARKRARASKLAPGETVADAFAGM